VRFVALALVLVVPCVASAEPLDKADTTADRAFQEAEPNNGFHEAQAITGNCDVVAAVNHPRDVDYFKFEVETPTYREGVRLRLMPTYLASGLMSLRKGPRGIKKALTDLRYLIDPRVHEGLLTLDDPQGSWAYIRKNLFRRSHEDG
jgi:hypothetical protein